jgi:predicted ATPase
MKLKTVEITEFQSVRKSNPFEVGDITCLVGKNEAGKTAVLQALYRLNPIIDGEGKFDVTDDYPRADVEDYQQEIDSGSRKPATVASATFQLSAEEMQQVEKDFGGGILERPELTLSKGYENTLYISLPINEKIAVEAFVGEAQLPAEVAGEFSRCMKFQELVEAAGSKGGAEGAGEHLKRLQTVIAKVQTAKGLILYIYDKYLKASVPKFLYFDEYYQMRGHENLDSLRTRVKQPNQLRPSDYPLLGLIALARLNLDELIDPKRTQWLINKLEGAGNHLSKKILKYWSQNKHVHMKFDARPARPGDPEGMTSGTNLWALVYDSKHLVTTPLGRRSRGFVWFFSFLAWFDQKQRNNEPLILLLDEPGLFLHGKAQGDLLTYMEKELKGSHQVIYTTHSPFMVDPHKFERVRIVQDKSMDTEEALPAQEEGTKVLGDVLEATEDSLFPLQGALGYEIHQTLFIGPNSLVVEGVSDLLFLQSISGLLEASGREGLSTKWTITPVGGSDKVPTFVALLGAQKGLNIATLIDIQKKDAQMIENLYKRKLLKKKNVLTFGDFTGTAEADIEDMLNPGVYISLVNAEYASDLSSPIVESKLGAAGTRILARLDQHFKNSPLKSAKQFNHYRPARYFAEKITDLRSTIEPETLNRFEAAFKALNQLL